MSVTCQYCGTANPDNARFCLNCAQPLSRAPEHEHEERKLATVLFADLVGSTSMADAQDDPERTRLLLNRFYDAMAAEVERYGGTVEKFAGDAVMAAFGAPAALEDHAERALHAALAMHERLGELFGGRLALRIGLNTGEVIVGRPREGSSFVTGDAVNVAARLEQAAQPGETLAGERTVAAAQGAFEFAEPATVEAKGKPGGVPARRVTRALSLMRPRGLREMPQVFVGRDAELAQLRDRYAAVASAKEPQLVTIFGDAGVGKTRLLRELADWLGEQLPVPIHRTGRALSYGQGTTYWPMGDILKEHFAIAEDEPADSISAKLAAHPYLGLTLGIGSSEEIHPLVARERLHDAWVAFLDQLVADRPVVLLIEDAHWADDQLCDLVDTLVALVSGPLLVLVTARQELLARRPAWGGTRDRTSALHLEALPAADSSRLLQQLLGTEVPDQIRDMIVERAEGNPFFVEELIATFVDRGVLQRTNGTWAFGQFPAGFAVPDSVQAVLAARIDLLADAEKAALQAASVIGRTFWTGPMYELVGAERPDIGILEDREFVRRVAVSTLPGQREYVIKHALTREVAYESLPRARRAQLHADFAEWLDRRMDGRDELAPFLAHHYATAVRPEDLDLAWAGRETQAERIRAKALVWLRRAADLAIGRYEIDDGISLLHRAVELEADQPRRAELWFQIGHASALKYDGQAMVAAMDRALELGADPGLVYPELAFQWALRTGMWQRRLDDSQSGHWIERALADSPDGSPGRVHALLAKSMAEDDVDAARAALVIANELGDPLLRWDAIGMLENTLLMKGEFDESLALAEQRMSERSQISDPDRLADALYVTAYLDVVTGRLADARAVAADMEQTVAGTTPHHRVHGFGIRIMVERAFGDWAAIRDVTSRVEAAVDENLATPCPFNRGLLIALAAAWTYGADAAEADRLLRRGEALGMDSYPRFLARHSLRLAIARNDRAEVRRLLGLYEPDWLQPDDWEGWTNYLDGLALLDDRERLEAAAPPLLAQDVYLTPFAMRALALVRRDASLLEEAAARFERLGVERLAVETRARSERLSSTSAG